MTRFTIYPAIDLLGGKVVRLKQGDPASQKTYSNDAAQVVETWISVGAEWLHIVNLDGALGNNTESNWDEINKIIKKNDGLLSIQFGGGIRSLVEIEKTISAGVRRVVLGTAAIENQEFSAQALEKFGTEQIAFALDAKNEKLMTHGWKTDTGRSVYEFAKDLADLGAKTLIYTNIETDGMGTGNDFEIARQIAKSTGLQIIASGGVASIEDVRKVKAANLSGLIIGRALYENQITLQEALAC